MAMFTFSVFINRSQQQVFDLLSNPGNPQPCMQLLQAEAWTSTTGVGSGPTGRGIMKIVSQELEDLLKVTRWDPPNCYGIKVTNMQLPFESMEYMYTLKPEDGGTRVILECESEWVGSP
jgi:hypothetical protein